MNSRIRRLLAAVVVTAGTATCLSGAFLARGVNDSHSSAVSSHGAGTASAFPGSGPFVASAFPGSGPFVASAFPGSGPFAASAFPGSGPFIA